VRGQRGHTCGIGHGMRASGHRPGCMGKGKQSSARQHGAPTMLGPGCTMIREPHMHIGTGLELVTGVSYASSPSPQHRPQRIPPRQPHRIPTPYPSTHPPAHAHLDPTRIFSFTTTSFPTALHIGMSLSPSSEHVLFTTTVPCGAHVACARGMRMWYVDVVCACGSCSCRCPTTEERPIQELGAKNMQTAAPMRNHACKHPCPMQTHACQYPAACNPMHAGTPAPWP
jgi:hypothetical protein